MILTAAQLREQFAPKTERIQIFETGHEVIVRSVPAHITVASQDHPQSDAFIVVNAVVDEKGQRYWNDDQVEEVARTLSAEVIQLIAIKALELGRVTPERAAVIKKNLESLVGEKTGESQSPLAASTQTGSTPS